MRTVVVDDEPFARMRLTRICEQHANLDVVAQAGSGSEALDVIRTHEPELLMLNLELPDMCGFEVLKLLESDSAPIAIVVAPRPDYAAEAFDNNALDYLTKPVEPERLLRAVHRARRKREQQLVGAERTCGNVAGARIRASELRLVGQRANRFYLLGSSTIEYIEVDGNYLLLYSGEERYITRNTLKDMEAALTPYGFMRIARSVLLNLQRVAFIEKLTGGDFAFELRNGRRFSSSASFRKSINAELRRVRPVSML